MTEHKTFSQMTGPEPEAERTFYTRRRQEAKRTVRATTYRIRAINILLERKKDMLARGGGPRNEL